MSKGKWDHSLTRYLPSIEYAFASDIRPRLERREQFKPGEQAQFLTFIAAMMARPSAQLEQVRAFFKDVLQKPGNGRHRPARNRQVDSERIVRGVRRESAGISPERALEVLGHLSISVMTTDDPVGFISSDSPCVLVSPELSRLPGLLRSPGTVQLNTELTLPLSPTHCLLLTNWPAEKVIHADEAMLEAVNRRTIHGAHESLVSRSAVLPRAWFERREPPPSPKLEVGAFVPGATLADGSCGPGVVVRDGDTRLRRELRAALDDDWEPGRWRRLSDTRRCGPGPGPRRLDVTVQLANCPPFPVSYEWDGASGVSAATITAFFPEIPESYVAEMRALAESHADAWAGLTDRYHTLIQGSRAFVVEAIRAMLVGVAPMPAKPRTPIIETPRPLRGVAEVRRNHSGA